jgi:ATP-binding cassette subfamily F protein uup
MSSLIGIHSISKSFGSQHLFSDISFTISEGERICLVGPNGAGKSTLLKIIMGIESADSGDISRRRGVRIAYASQLPEFPDKSIEQVLLEERSHGDLIERETRARILLSKVQFTDFSQSAHLLSGGWKKRLDIARALMHEPDLLLLDEPTNHLDLEGIVWLENFLRRERCAFLIVSHDRYFLDNIATKVIEINRCFPMGIFVSEGNMASYMENKNNFLEAQAQRQRGLASTVRAEKEWLAKSPQARTTKSESRIKNAYKLMDELSAVKSRNRVIKVDLSFNASERETRKLIVANNVTKSLSGRQLFKGIDLTLSPGTRLGIVGKNGTGKTTLLKILSGSIKQDMGTIKYAENLKLVYFDQHRERIPSKVTLKEALSPNGDFVDYHGQSIHVNGWAQRFLFETDRLTLPVEKLSGGERARILIARLMLEPADVLFLDEPTNDLDIPTLEVMEESLKEFEGAVVMISHDRCLMDRVCTSILGLGEGIEQQFFADYSQWEKACMASESKKNSVGSATGSGSNSGGESAAKISGSSSKKLTFKEQKELEGMEETIMKTEGEVERLQKELDDPKVQSDGQRTVDLYKVLGEAQSRLDELFVRWEYLSDKSQGKI